ncbi:DUF5675 family protein [Owenweeksia hongkongensis]|uniref:DUF5675 family protein n=1 Tax=Owenweeksia hongkongensis TaxID=253245 RepID=UPI003A90EEE7
MKRILFLLLVALVTLGVLLFIFNPEVIEKVWLWLIGLAGVIVTLMKKGIDWAKGLFNKPDNQKDSKTEENEDNAQQLTALKKSWQSEKSKLTARISELESKLLSPQDVPDDFEGTTITLLRYVDDGDTTLGLLFYNGKFYCYTLEDTFRETKIAGQTRIPKGTYKLGFNKSLTGLTQKYRDKYPWFEYHLHLKNVPGYEGIYIHVGNYHKDTDGCILLADGIGAKDSQLMVTHSQQAYKRFYLQIKKVLDREEQVRICIKDEAWIASITKHSEALLID